MKDGFVTLAAGTPAISLADPAGCARAITALLRDADRVGASAVVLPRLCLCGCSCGDLFLQRTLLDAAERALLDVAASTADLGLIAFVGLPLPVGGKLYDCAAAVAGGRILGIVPATHVKGADRRYFTPAPTVRGTVRLGGAEIPFGRGLLFTCENAGGLIIGVEIGTDADAAVPPSATLTMAGALVIAHLNAEAETVVSASDRLTQCRAASARLRCAIVSAGAGSGESTTDFVYGGASLICDGGHPAAVREPFSDQQLITAPVDLDALLYDRRREDPFAGGDEVDAERISFTLPLRTADLKGHVAPYPFIPGDEAERRRRCAHILSIQAQGLARRLTAAHAGGAVVAVSGGLDSCLAILVTARAMDLIGWPRAKITAVTMPCYGTTGRTKSNAELLSEALGASFRTIDIAEAVGVHFRDIGHNPDEHNVVYENAQARERTQIIMDLANETNALVIGTGDLSELALGWATYNGDHMSNYGVNAGIPKTLIRAVVAYCADDARENGHAALADVLTDILATPVSPELLPPKDGEISQRTEDIVGPYDLHDFCLYHFIRHGTPPAKIYRLACAAFQGKFDEETIRRWLIVFCRRFFTQQFKRSCMPDGPAVGSVTLSPRGGWAMPSDALSAEWIREAEGIRETAKN